ncbi:hypothetical protein AcV7_005174 [Taiwanofungus camphoratus]|nr:hypothetical protein AcW2_005773 [Antrodia cinnamomea]KAI0929702.1 hypothetical protein AcV7_005174 [Antrodia cinnamomea]
MSYPATSVIVTTGYGDSTQKEAEIQIESRNVKSERFMILRVRAFDASFRTIAEDFPFDPLSRYRVFRQAEYHFVQMRISFPQRMKTLKKSVLQDCRSLIGPRPVWRRGT